MKPYRFALLSTRWARLLQAALPPRLFRTALPTLLLLLGASCTKDHPAPQPTPCHIRIDSMTVVPLPWADPVGTAFQVTMRIVADSLPKGETPLSTGICWAPAPEVPHRSDTTLHIDITMDPDEDMSVPYYWRIPAPFLPPGEEWNIRSYLCTDRDIYYSDPVVYAPPAIPTDDNCVDIPVIFHLLTPDPGAVSPLFGERILGFHLANANLSLRDALAHSQLWEPSEDVHLRLVPVTHTPSGERLAQPGLDIVRWARLPIEPKPFLETPSPEELALCWDPNRYLNVWIFPFGGDRETSAAGMATPPIVPPSHPLEGLIVSDYYDSHPRDINPGIALNGNYLYIALNTPLGHEFGHVLGLEHAFSVGGCGTDDDYCADTRDYDYSAFLASENSFFFNLRPDCNDGTQFLSFNVMDYDGYSVSFTPDQNARMQHVLRYGYFIPGSETARATAGQSKAPRNTVRPTPRTIVDPPRSARGNRLRTGPNTPTP